MPGYPLQSFLGQQHTAHVGVHNDWVRRAIGVFRPGEAAHGQAILGIGQGALKGQLHVRKALCSSAHSGGVHKGEHAVQARFGSPIRIALGAVEIKHAGGVTVNTHLFSIDAQCTALRSPRAAVVIDVNLGHDKQGYPLVPSGASGSRARTIWTMLSVISCSPALMNIFVPVMA